MSTVLARDRPGIRYHRGLRDDNPWDGHEILTQHIFRFSGHHHYARGVARTVSPGIACKPGSGRPAASRAMNAPFRGAPMWDLPPLSRGRGGDRVNGRGRVGITPTCAGKGLSDQWFRWRNLRSVCTMRGRIAGCRALPIIRAELFRLPWPGSARESRCRLQVRQPPSCVFPGHECGRPHV